MQPLPGGSVLPPSAQGAQVSTTQRPPPGQPPTAAQPPGTNDASAALDVALLMDFTSSAPAGPDLLQGPSVELQASLPDAPSRDWEGRTASHLYKELSGDGAPSEPRSGASASAAAMAGSGQVPWGAPPAANKRKRVADAADGVRPAPRGRAANAASKPVPAPPGPWPKTQEVWWAQDNKTKAWKEYETRDTDELEHAWEAKEMAERHRAMQLPAAAAPEVLDRQFKVDITAMEQHAVEGDKPRSKVQRCALTAGDITKLPRSKDLLPKPAGPAVAGFLYEIANHPELRPHTGLSVQTMPNGSLGFRLDLSGKERDEPDIEQKGNYIAELLNAVFSQMGKEVDFGCTSTPEDRAKPTEELPLAHHPKNEDSMLALLGQGDPKKPDIRTVRVQRCVNKENQPIYKRTIFKWAPNKSGGGKWRRQKRWDSVRKHLSDPVLVPTTIGTVRMQFWSNETGGGQKEGDFSQVYTERCGGTRDRVGSTAKRGGIGGSFKRCAALLAVTERLPDNKSWKTLFDEVVQAKLAAGDLESPTGATGAAGGSSSGSSSSGSGSGSSSNHSQREGTQLQYQHDAYALHRARPKPPPAIHTTTSALIRDLLHHPNTQPIQHNDSGGGGGSSTSLTGAPSPNMAAAAMHMGSLAALNTHAVSMASASNANRAGGGLAAIKRNDAGASTSSNQAGGGASSSSSGAGGGGGGGGNMLERLNDSAAAMVREMSAELGLESTLSDPRKKAEESFQAALSVSDLEGTQSKPLPDGEVLNEEQAALSII